MLGLGLAIPALAVRRRSTLAHHAATDALLARMTTAPSAQRAGLIDTLIRALVDNGIWSTLDLFYILAAHDDQAASLNWKSSLYTLTPVNAPVFTADRGYQGDGATASLNTGFSPLAAPAGMQQALNSAAMGAFALAGANNTGFEFGSVNGRVSVRVRSTTGAARINSNTSLVSTGVPYPSSLMAVRRDAAAQLAFVSGSPAGSDTTASVSLADQITLLRSGSNYTDRLVPAASMGAALTDAQIAVWHQSIRTYLVGVGAIAA